MLTAEQRAALLGQPSAPRSAPPTRTTPSAATGRPAPPPERRAAQRVSPGANPLAKMAKTLAVWSIVPLFPIAIVTVLVSAVALARASTHPGRPGRSDAIIGLLAGLVFSTSWLALTLWYIRSMLVR